MNYPIWVPQAGETEVERERITREADAIGGTVLAATAKAAFEAAKRSYSPYSHFSVGAAVLDTAGGIHAGQNVEVVTMSETGHAEEQAIKNAVSAGCIGTQGTMFVRAVVSTAAPCGRCRQIIAEFSDNPLIVTLNGKGEIAMISSLSLLLPLAFTPKDLR